MKKILINSLNGFSANDIPMFIFQLLVAALLVRLVQLVWSKKFNAERGNYFVVMALVFTFMAIVAKYSLPFAVLSVGVILWLGKSENQTENRQLLKLIVGLIGIGVGSFNIVLTIMLTLLILMIVWFFPNKEDA